MTSSENWDPIDYERTAQNLLVCMQACPVHVTETLFDLNKAWDRVNKNRDVILNYITYILKPLDTFDLGLMGNDGFRSFHFYPDLRVPFMQDVMGKGFIYWWDRKWWDVALIGLREEHYELEHTVQPLSVFASSVPKRITLRE